MDKLEHLIETINSSDIDETLSELMQLGVKVRADASINNLLMETDNNDSLDALIGYVFYAMCRIKKLEDELKCK